MASHDELDNSERGSGPRVSRRGVLGMSAAALAVAGVGLTVVGCDSSGTSSAEETSTTPVGPSDHIVDQHKRVQQSLPFSDTVDFADADRGFIAAPESEIVKDANGNVVWDSGSYAFLAGSCPNSVNPSLWRQSQLVVKSGLYEVAPGFYQVRGLDLSNMTLIEGDRGVVVIDPLISVETARAGLELYRRHRGDRPVTGLIYTHSHVDHFGGAMGVTTQEEVTAGRVPVLAPQGFLEHAVAENIYAGTAMARRSAYMYGAALPRGERGQVGVGLGMTTSTGTVSLIAPTRDITHTGQEEVIDGVRMVFQITPGTEAPSEMNFHFPDHRALCMAENATHTLHNLLTLRGALVRDAHVWARYLTEAITLFADKTEVAFASHHWPMWGTDKITEWLSLQRDTYAYLHDQTLRLLNQGYVGTEIAEMIRMPPALEAKWYNHGYYGSVSHDVKAIYQRYMGWFDGNPAHLWEHPPVEAAKRYVDAMGGAEEAMKKARKAYADGDYRWVVQLVNHVIFADPDNRKAKMLQASAFEQLGYGSENGTWRNFYLSGAQELRNGNFGTPTKATSPTMLAALTVDQIFDSAAFLVNGPKAWDLHLTNDWTITDENKTYRTELRNGVLIHYVLPPDFRGPAPDAALTLTRPTLLAVLTGGMDIAEAVKSGAARVSGDPGKLKRINDVLDKPNPKFNIVTP
ncbi:MBL fold metallo-hydrolase [Nocardia sp. CDC159]|uniref:Linear primary-alkylsulfatase n=1 Tax=Nocardia pulmonis TaxID=2951408 RepID=A0A9X2EE20_9NOCA|nr:MULTISPECIES: alkyl sulfatase dimerization domain-containing protein [Nocardia]MCM6778656.1 MBL fold metallo-hydrolase [Nocardia pulmonis]MCM6791545.1 MBL fold metallo-hydrolase [Nocardia sp. CDC159]